MQVHVGWQVSPNSRAPTVSSARNGPPDIKTIDRRRVAPPAGCRVTTEPATVAGRRSAERCTTEEQSNSALHQQRTRQPNIEQFTALAARAWGTSSGLAVSGGRSGGSHRRPGGSACGRLPPILPVMHISRRRAVVFSVMRLACTRRPAGRGAFAPYPSGSPPLMRPNCITNRPLRAPEVHASPNVHANAYKHDRFRQVRARHCPHVQHRIGTDHPGGARTRDPGRAAADAGSWKAATRRPRKKIARHRRRAFSVARRAQPRAKESTSR